MTLPKMQLSEYPGAARFVSAAPTNYRARPAPPALGSRAITRIITHITDGGANINGTISWFKNPAAKVSAHYIVGQDGEVVQMVLHKDVAWHAGAANSNSIGIEHVANTRGLLVTEVEYEASADLVRWLCTLFKIPMDRAHVLGHCEVDKATSHRGCPNAVWGWEQYMTMLVPPTIPMAPTDPQSV
jgi:N-acetyl-anhydromuramyl-L-alanine amidase AmpD